jgi:cytochrome c oxidase cbb3-type subunit I/II
MYPDFIETITSILPMWWFRVVGGTLFLGGASLCAYNFYRTWTARPTKYHEPVLEAPALARAYLDPPVRSRIRGQVIGVVHKLDRWEQAAWHRRWERLPLRFTVWTILAVAVASLFEIIPTFLIQSNVPTITSVQPYTPLELAGRDVYLANGCYNCHSQQIRPIVAETKRYGEYSKPGEFVYDHPFQWGSRRIGPDLARESQRPLAASWHYLHMIDPRQVSQRSVMPSYPQIASTKLDFGAIEVFVLDGRGEHDHRFGVGCVLAFREHKQRPHVRQRRRSELQQLGSRRTRRRPPGSNKTRGTSAAPASTGRFHQVRSPFAGRAGHAPLFLHLQQA